MSTSTIRIEPDSLRQLSSAMAQDTEQMREAYETFRQRVGNVPESTFGDQKLANQHQQAYNTTCTQTEAMLKEFSDTADALAKTAHIMELVDQAVTQMAAGGSASGPSTHVPRGAV